MHFVSLPPRTLALLTAGALLLTGCSATVFGHGTPASSSSAPSSGAPSSGAPSAVVPSVGRVDFGSCDAIFDSTAIPAPSSLRGKLSYGCAQLNVPVDYADPSGASLSIQLVKVHDRDNTGRLGSLLVNPGGPGASGVELALELVDQLSPDILTNFDLVGFDPRGVGLSSPVSCISDGEKDTINAASPDVLTAAGRQQAKQLAQLVAQACTTKYGAALAQYDTVNTARDMDLIRQGVGDAQLTYLGFSYGTELGSVYAHLFPGKIRAAVLDGAVDPLTSGVVAFGDQIAGFESAFDQFAANCLTQSPCQSLGNPRQAVYDIVATATRAPLGTSDQSETRRVTSSLVLTGVLKALYSQRLWPDLGKALIAAKAGDGKGLLALADLYNERQSDGTYTNVMDANTAIGCNDSKPGPSDAAITETAQTWAVQYPMFGAWAAISLYGCQQWQPVRTPPPLPTATGTRVKVLVIGNLHDPATPYQGAKDLVSTMGNAELLTWDGEGHTSYLSGSSCIDSAVNAYLISQTLPADGEVCPR